MVMFNFLTVLVGVAVLTTQAFGEEGESSYLLLVINTHEHENTHT